MSKIKRTLLYSVLLSGLAIMPVAAFGAGNNENNGNMKNKTEQMGDSSYGIDFYKKGDAEKNDKETAYWHRSYRYRPYYHYYPYRPYYYNYYYRHSPYYYW